MDWSQISCGPCDAAATAPGVRHIHRSPAKDQDRHSLERTEDVRRDHPKWTYLEYRSIDFVLDPPEFVHPAGAARGQPGPS